MSDEPQNSADLADKIARLVKERGWNMEDFVRISNLNRNTIRQIMGANKNSGDDNRVHKLRNDTISKCAKALGLSVNELYHWPLDRLLQRMNNPRAGEGEETLKRLYERATQPELLAWLERNPDRAGRLTSPEMDELLSLQGPGGPLATLGVEHYVGQIERRRRLLERVQTIAGTEYIDLLEKLVELLYDKVQPYGGR